MQFLNRFSLKMILLYSLSILLMYSSSDFVPAQDKYLTSPSMPVLSIRGLKEINEKNYKYILQTNILGREIVKQLEEGVH